MKKIYLIYAKIPFKVWEEYLKYTIVNDKDFRYEKDYMIGLYGWTSKKSVLKDFLSMRKNSIYTVIETDYDEGYKKIKSDYRDDISICYHKFSSGEENKYINIASTKGEYTAVVYDSSEYLYEFGPQVNQKDDYIIFKREIREALDFLGYTTEYDLCFGDDDRKSRAIENRNKNKTVFNKSLVLNNKNELQILIYLYYYLFMGV